MQLIIITNNILIMLDNKLERNPLEIKDQIQEIKIKFFSPPRFIVLKKLLYLVQTKNHFTIINY